MASIVLDSSSLISLSDTCNSNIIRFLADHVDGKLYITPGVQHEIISRPLGIRRYESSALRLKRLLDDRALSIISTPNLAEETKRVLNLTNNLIYSRGRPLQLVQQGEAECVACFAGAQLGAIAMDEKTTRLLIENPSKLIEPISSEYKTHLEVNHERMEEWRAYCKGIKVIRSAELIAVAGELGYYSEYGPLAPEATIASLYAARNAGLSITERELNDYEKIILGGSNNGGNGK